MAVQTHLRPHHVGKVASGRGDLTQWMRRYLEAYERAVGVRREPGSRNVVLDKPWVMDRLLARLEASEVGVGLGGPLSLARALPTHQGLAGA